MVSMGVGRKQEVFVIKYKWELDSANVNGILQWSLNDCVSRDHRVEPSRLCDLQHFPHCSGSRAFIEKSRSAVSIGLKSGRRWTLAIVVCLIHVNSCL